jgi:uncharacterized protein YggT (Ycf19 family)
MEDRNNLVRDEERRQTTHQDVKASIDSDVNRQIKQESAQVAPAESAEIKGVATEMKQRSVHEAVSVEREVGRGKVAARVSQVIDYIFYIIYGLISLQFMLSLLGARQGNQFVQFVHAISRPFTGPFEGIVITPSAGPIRIQFSYLIALIVFILIHLAINGALRLVAHRKLAV